MHGEASASGRPEAPLPGGGGRARAREQDPDRLVPGLSAAPVSTLAGVGPVTAARLAAHGLATVSDVLGFLPRGYDDLRTMTPVALCPSRPEGSVVVVAGTITQVSVVPGRFLTVRLEQDGHRLTARWFRVPAGMGRAFVKGDPVALAGPLRFGRDGQPELVHPTNVTAAMGARPPSSCAPSRAGAVALGGDPAVDSVPPPPPPPPLPTGLGVRPRYGVVPGVGARVVEKVVGLAVTRFAGQAPDALPPAVCRRLGLPSAAEALRQLHQPDAATVDAEQLAALGAGRSPAHRRLALEDLLVVQVGLAARRLAVAAEPGWACSADASATGAAVAATLPFSLTGAQRRAISQIHAELGRATPMQRLLVGDVGSGKTAVAFAAAVQVARSGGQTLLMTPTEVLAEQHVRTMTPWAEALGIRLALLTASTSRPRRETLLALARAGQVGILVGTQALLADRVALPALGLAIVDEQHRFGVAQRAQLRQRDPAQVGVLPHLLVMTATPIPRTLAFTLYGDLELTVLDEIPPGRQPVRTRVLLGEEGRRQSEVALRAAVAAGQRAFVVCPVRELSTREGAVTAIARHAELVRALAPARVGLAHGALPTREKDAVLRAFAAGALDVLVATTLVEVGIDVPEATLMVVEEAERFGLAQLHQLRGRVGRGAVASECLLVAGVAGAGTEPGQTGAGRLATLARSSDGFAIAEADLAQRGCGELFGERQSGMPRLRCADFGQLGELLEQARGEAETILRNDPTLSFAEHAGLRECIRTRWAGAAIYAAEAG